MSDYLNVDGVIDITVKDKFGNIKTKNTVRNAVSDLGKMIFLYEGAKVCTLTVSLMSAYISNSYENMYVPSCLSLLNLNGNHLNIVKGNGGVVSYLLTDSSEVVFCEYDENGDETSGFTKSEVDSCLFQFVVGKRYSFKTGSIVGSINAIAMTGSNTCALPAINLFKRFGIGKVQSPGDFSSHHGYLLPGIIYNKGKDNEVRWTEPDEVLFRFFSSSSKDLAVGVRLLTGDITVYNTVADRYPEDKYPTVDRSLGWKDICIIGVRDYYGSAMEDYPTAVIKNNLYIMSDGLKHYVIGSSNITEDRGFLTVTHREFPHHYDDFIALVYDDHSIKVVLYLQLSMTKNELRSFEFPLNEYGAPIIREEYPGHNVVDVSTTSTEVNSDLSLAGESQYYKCGIDFRTIPAFIRKEFGSVDRENRKPLITQIQDKYYLSIKGDGYTCTPIYEFTDLSDIKGSMTGKVLSAVYYGDRCDPDPIMYVDDSLSYVISTYVPGGDGNLYSVVSGPNWSGNIISMRVLDEPLVVTKEDTLEITYMYTTGDFSSTNFIAENTDGNKPISVG